MAQNRKFKSAAESRRFKQLGQGLRVSEERIKEQRQGELEGIKLAQLQHKENSNAYLSGLNTKHQFEEGVLREKQGLEQKVREHKYAALAKKAETDVARLEGEYKDKLKYSEWLDKWAPNFAKNMGKLAQGGLHFVDTYRGQKQWEALKESGILDELTDQKSEANLELSKNITKDGFTLDPDSANVLHDKTWKVNTHWASKRLSQWYKENKDLVRSDAIAAFESVDGKYNEHSAVEVQKWNAYTLLKRVGISPTSAGGKEIMELATSMGRLDRKTYADTRRVGETESRIENHLNGLKGVDINSADFTLKMHELSNLYRNGWFKADNGKVSSPWDNPRSIADGLELGITSFIEANIDSLTMEQVDAILKIATPAVGKDDKAMPFNERHVTRAEGIRDNYLKLKEKQIEKLNSEKEDKGLTTYNQLEESWNNKSWLTDERYSNLGTDAKKYEQWLSDTINSISKNKDYTDKTRALAYELISFNPKNHKSAGLISDIKDDLIQGNYKEALQRFNAITDKTTRDAVIEEIEMFSKLNESFPEGMKGIFAQNEALLKSAQEAALWGGNDLDRNGKEMLAVVNQKWYEKYKSLVNGGVDHKQAVKDANFWLEQEWKDGEKDDKGTHWLHRKEGTGPGKKVTFSNLKDQNDKALERNKLLTNLDQAAESSEDNMVYTTETVETLMNNSKDHDKIPGFDGNLLGLLTKDEMVTKKSLVKLNLQIENLRKQNEAGSVNVGDLDIPANIETFIKLYRHPPGHKNAGKPMTKAEALQHVFEAQGLDIKVLQGEDAARLIQNDTLGYTETNDVAHTYFNASKIQGVLPTRNDVREYLYGRDEKDGIGVKTHDVSILDIFSKRTGIQFKDLGNGRYAFNDTKGVLLNGGLNLPLNTTPQQLLDSLGYTQHVRHLVGKIGEDKRSSDIMIKALHQPSLN